MRLGNRSIIATLTAAALGIGGWAFAAGESANAPRITASSHCVQSGDIPGRALDGDLATRWCARPGTNGGWLEVDLGRPTRINHLVLVEGKGETIRRFQVMVHQGGRWVNVAYGGFIGARRDLAFDPVTTQRLRLVICEAADAPSIAELQINAHPVAAR